MPLVNNYGVWTDEFKALGLEHTLERSWPDASCFFGEGKPVRLGRGYGRVSRRKLREHLVAMCAEAGVTFLAAEVDSLQGVVSPVGCRLVTLAAGAAAGKFLRYEEGAPSVASQTAYGIEAEVEGYHEAFPGNEMLFMDFRRHHTGVWEQSAPKIRVGSHPNAGDGEWGTSGEVPSFLYAMPLGGDRVFLEETCLVAKVHEEEWSYIPVGGPLPKGDQAVAAFGAAANLVHPATGFSVSRSFREAPRVADELAACIRAGLGVRQASARVWSTLWPQEKRTQTAFHVFGMELLATLDLASTNAFFGTFFKLPSYYWRGYMASQLSSGELIIFALLTFALANNDIRAKLMVHLFSDPAGRYLLDAYVKRYRDSPSPSPSSSPSSSLSALPTPAPAPAVEVKLPASLEPNQA
ncbi:chloroplast lycopene epsilon-cyclase [Haematococcus lacustris]|uniref:Chloroplast lycopene epsilon-cyclase n=1 Tax=Haematococcus lacustris TaxID=44745 RepID=A0A699Z8A1_HAELA|nr:chloroplast lycopene epsilon-cyclase [Haematococcus lacustris]